MGGWLALGREGGREGGEERRRGGGYGTDELFFGGC